MSVCLLEVFLTMDLRKVLDYLEDRLEPAEVAEVGALLRQRPEGRALLERIQVHQAHLAGAPETSTIDANLIAAYLDGVLSEETVRDLERQTQHDNFLLVEIVGAHACLPLNESPTNGIAWGESEGLNIARLLRAAGQRNISRSVSNASPARPAALPSKPVGRKRLNGILIAIGIGAILLLLSWAGFVWETSSGTENETTKTDKTIVIAEAKPQPKEQILPPPVIIPAAPEPRMPEPLPVAPAPAAAIALRPQLPVPVAADTTTRQRACTVSKVGGALLAKSSENGAWKRLPAGADVSTLDHLMAPPGFAPELELPGGAKLIMWGNLPEASGNPMVQECEVRLHTPARGVLADFEIQEGRVYLRSGPTQNECVFHARFAGESWEIRLNGPNSEALLEKVPLPTSEESWLQGTPVGSDAVLAAIRGSVHVVVDQVREIALDGIPADRVFITWNSLRGTVSGPFANRADEPLWHADGARSPKERQAYLAAFKELDKALMPGVHPSVALDNIVNRATATSAARFAALFAMGCLGDYNRLMGEMLDEQAPEERRQAAAGSLRHWISESTDRSRMMHDPNTESGYLVTKRDMTPQEAAYLVRLLLPMDETQANDRTVLRALVADLSHPRMAIRVAAQHALTDLAVGPFIHKSPVIYNSKGSEASWRLSQSAWKRLVDEGKIPGKPAGP